MFFERKTLMIAIVGFIIIVLFCSYWIFYRGDGKPHQADSGLLETMDDISNRHVRYDDLSIGRMDNDKTRISTDVPGERESGWMTHPVDPECIDGCVFDCDGLPIADANIYWIIDPLDTGPPPPFDKFTDGECPFVKTTKRGTFVIKVNTSDRYHLLARKDGYLPILFSAKAGEHHVVRMVKKSGSLSGTIVNGDDGRPIGGVKVTIRYGIGFHTMVCSTVSGGDGEYYFDSAPGFINAIWFEINGYDEVRYSGIPINFINGKTVEMYPCAKMRIGLKLMDSITGEIIHYAQIQGKDSRSDMDGIHWMDISLDSERVEIYADNYCKKTC